MNVIESKVFTDEREAGGIEPRELRALRRETETLEIENQMNALRLTPQMIMEKYDDAVSDWRRRRVR